MRDDLAVCLQSANVIIAIEGFGTFVICCGVLFLRFFSSEGKT